MSQFLHKSDESESNCEEYDCFIWNPLNPPASKRTKRNLDLQQDQNNNDYEFTVIFLQNLLRYIGLSATNNGEEMSESLTYITTTIGSWAKFSGAIFVLGIPVTIFVVALFLVALVTTPTDSDDEAREAETSTIGHAERRRRKIGHNNVLNNPSLVSAVEMLHDTDCSDSQLCKYIHMHNN